MTNVLYCHISFKWPDKVKKSCLSPDICSTALQNKIRNEVREAKVFSITCFTLLLICNYLVTPLNGDDFLIDSLKNTNGRIFTVCIFFLNTFPTASNPIIIAYTTSHLKFQFNILTDVLQTFDEHDKSFSLLKNESYQMEVHKVLRIIIHHHLTIKRFVVVL